MNSKPALTKSGNLLSKVAALLVLVPAMAMSQVPLDENGAPLVSIDEASIHEASIDGDIPMDAELVAEAPLLTSLELAELIGPVALYPDDLLAIVLPASSYPLEIVQAARFLEQLESDPSLEPDESWDESITALLNYPEVVQMMDEDIDWTWRLGEAVIAQQEELIAAIEAFRDSAYAAGNLKSDEHQEVSNNDDGIIEIVPVDEELIYVPYYEPEEVLVYQSEPVYHYYPQAYPVYYYPYPVGHHFSSGYFWGVTTAFSIGWNNNYLHVYHPSYWGHPYYGRSYYSHYYRRPSINIYNNWYVNNSYRTSGNRHRDGDYWRPRHRSGARPQEQRVRNQYYPSRNNESTRRNSGSYDRDRMQLRDQGRMNLGLRERSQNGASTAANRSVTSRSSTTRSSNTGNNGTTASNSTRRERQTEQRRSRDNSGTNVRRNNSDLGSQRSERASFADRRSDSRSESNGSNRRNTDSVAVRRNTQRTTSSDNSQSQRSRQRQAQTDTASRAPAARQTSNQRRSATPRSSAQPRRTQATSSRPAPTARAAAPASRERAPARQQVQRSANSGQSNAAAGRKESSARATNRQRKRKQ
jgi:hypothetical protein